MNFRILKIPAGNFFARDKIPSGIMKNPRRDNEKSLQGYISPPGFANPRGDFDLCHEYFPGHYRFKAKNL